MSRPPRPIIVVDSQTNGTPPQPAPAALPPPRSRPSWVDDPAYIELAKQALKALGSAKGGRNRVAATMSRVLAQARDGRDPGVELERLCHEVTAVARLLDQVRVQQVTQARAVEEHAESESLRERRAIAARSR